MSMTPQNSNESAHHVLSLPSDTQKPLQLNNDCRIESRSHTPKIKSSRTRRANDDHEVENATSAHVETEASTVEVTGRERLKRHRVEMAGRVWIPDLWGQEELLKDWVVCNPSGASLLDSHIMSARKALVQEGRRANSNGLRIENRC